MINVNNLFVTKQSTIKDALIVIDKSSIGLALLVDESQCLLRTVTDGDLRRLIINGANITQTLSLLPELHSVSLDHQPCIDTALDILNEHNINHLPIVDKNNVPVAIVSRKDISSKILLSVPHIGHEETKYVQEAFDTNWVAPLGPNVDAFEKEVAEYTGIKYATAVNSGTAAIHLALCVLNVTKNDIVFCSSFTFIASASPIVYQGATPVFIDSEPDSWNMSPIALLKAFEYYAKRNIKPKAVVIVNLYGQSANYEELTAICAKYDVPIVEDAAESIGASYKNKASGSFGTIGVFSFNGNKIITTSGGGMLVSDNFELIQRAKFLSTQAKLDKPYYYHDTIGYNYRMSNILAGIGRGQLKVLDTRVNARRKIFDNYKTGLANITALDWMPESSQSYSTHWLSTCTINPNKTHLTPQKIIDYLAENNIEARRTWNPMHQQPVFKDCMYFKHTETSSDIKEISVSDYLFDYGLCLPSSSSLTSQQQQKIIAVISNIFTEVTCPA
jgi:dTDP-4-amino-4,6-dideoxygalactose transaminase